jgi:NADH:ubiquinone oxidoreductase subunit 6 (subunit J)
MFIAFVIIDALLALGMGYEAFFVSSNKNGVYQQRFFVILALLIAGLIFRKSKPTLAMYLVGAPAVLLLLFIVIFFLSMMLNKGRWN